MASSPAASRNHRTGAARHAKAQFGERPAEQAVHFVTPAAAPVADDFLENLRALDGDRTAELHVEILIGDRAQMGAMQRRQCRKIGTQRTGIADAFEVFVDLHEDPMVARNQLPWDARIVFGSRRYSTAYVTITLALIVILPGRIGAAEPFSPAEISGAE